MDSILRDWPVIVLVTLFFGAFAYLAIKSRSGEDKDMKKK